MQQLGEKHTSKSLTNHTRNNAMCSRRVIAVIKMLIHEQCIISN